MDFLGLLAERASHFANSGFNPDLKILPSRRTMIICCVDPRVDPMDILELEPGEAAIIRNVGGRVNSSLFQTLGMLRAVSKAAGQEIGAGWNLIVLHHTDCGIIGCFHHAPGLLAAYMGVDPAELDGPAIVDPYKAVALDVEALQANEQVPGAFVVSGLVYDVKTGKTETVVLPAPLRIEEA